MKISKIFFSFFYRQVNESANNLLNEIKYEIESFFENSNYEIEVKILEILIDQAKSDNYKIKLTVFEWINKFLNKYKFFFIQSSKYLTSYNKQNISSYTQNLIPQKNKEINNFNLNKNFDCNNFSKDSISFTCLQNVNFKKIMNLNPSQDNIKKLSSNKNVLNYNKEYSHTLENNPNNQEVVSPIPYNTNRFSFFNNSYLSSTDLTNVINTHNNNIENNTFSEDIKESNKKIFNEDKEKQNFKNKLNDNILINNKKNFENIENYEKENEEILEKIYFSKRNNYLLLNLGKDTGVRKIPFYLFHKILEILFLSLNSSQINNEILKISDEINETLHSIIDFYNDSDTNNIKLFEEVFVKFLKINNENILKKLLIWIKKLFIKFHEEMFIDITTFLDILSDLLLKDKENIFNSVLEILGEISKYNEKYFEIIIRKVLEKFSKNISLLNERASKIIINFCKYIDIERIYLILAEELQIIKVYKILFN